MRLLSVDLITLRMPLVSPFQTSFGTQNERTPMLVRVHAETAGPTGDPVEVIGWGECVALVDPVYSSEYLDGARDVLTRFLIPLLFAHQGKGGTITAETVAEVLRPIVGNRMAKSAIEMAVLDAQLRGRGESLSAYLGATVDRVPAGVSVGIMPSVDQLLETVDGYLAQGYRRIKLKIQPGWDIAPVAAIRQRFGDELLLQVDANAAYTLRDAVHLARLDEFGLLLIEQPLGEEDLRQHSRLATMMSTPMCLDESIVSAEAAADAIALNAAAVINIKPGRVGGYLEARRIHDIARAHGIAVWCGGMLETGVGRAANAALAGLPGFTLPGDISASSRFFREDVTEPFVLEDGYIRIPTGPGIGVEPDADRLAAMTTSAVQVTSEG